MKAILPGSLKGSGCDWVETLRGLTFDVPQEDVSPVWAVRPLTCQREYERETLKH